MSAVQGATADRSESPRRSDDASPLAPPDSSTLRAAVDSYTAVGGKSGVATPSQSLFSPPRPAHLALNKSAPAPPATSDLRATALPEIFISYSHYNHQIRQSVAELAKKLAARGYRVLYDRERADPHEPWPTFLNRALTCEKVVVVVDESYAYFSRAEMQGLAETQGRGVAQEAAVLGTRLYRTANNLGWLVPLIFKPFATEAHIPPLMMPYQYFVIDASSSAWPGFDKLLAKGLAPQTQDDDTLHRVNRMGLWHRFEQCTEALTLFSNLFILCHRRHDDYYQHLSDRARNPREWRPYDEARGKLRDFWRTFATYATQGALPDDIFADIWTQRAGEYLTLLEPADIINYFRLNLWQGHTAEPPEKRFYLCHRPVQYDWLEARLTGQHPSIQAIVQRNRRLAADKAMAVVREHHWDVRHEALCQRRGGHVIDLGWAHRQLALHQLEHAWLYGAVPALAALTEYHAVHGEQATLTVMEGASCEHGRDPLVVRSFGELSTFWRDLVDKVEAETLPTELFDPHSEQGGRWINRAQTYVALAWPLEQAEQRWFASLSGHIADDAHDVRPRYLECLERKVQAALSKKVGHVAPLSSRRVAAS